MAEGVGRGQMMDSLHAVLRGMSPGAFLALGADRLAYIRLVAVEGCPVYVLHAADGTPLSLADTLEGALVVARENDLSPVSLQ